MSSEFSEFSPVDSWCPAGHLQKRHYVRTRNIQAWIDRQPGNPHQWICKECGRGYRCGEMIYRTVTNEEPDND